VPVIRRNTKKSAPDHGANYLIRQIDQLQQLSADYRRTFLGDDFFNESRNFYNMSLNQTSRTPSFRPRIEIPQLQMFACTEASDLADADPKIYIVHDPQGKKPQRDKQREKVFQANWREGFFNIQIMYASIWSLLAGNGYIHNGFDRFANQGRGRVWIMSRDPETVYTDPAAIDDDGRYYLIWTDRMYPDQVKNLFPERGRYVHAAPPSAIKDAGSTTTMTPTMIMPPGPMSTVGGMPDEKLGIGDGRVQVRVLLIKDPTVQDVVREKGGSDESKILDKVLPTKFEKKYPNGRMVVDCDGVILYDGDSPYPRGSFPITRICGLPPLNNYYAPPPVRISRNLQETSQRMLVQAFENAVRLNNGVWFIDEATGLTAEDFGGIPAEVRVIAANARYPELKLPRPFPPQFIEYPKLLLQLQKELQGFPDSRQGKQGQGNVSVDLYSEAVFHAQSLTRLRAKLMAESVYKVAEQVFYMMAAYYHDIHFADFQQDFELVPWERVESADEWRLYLDPGSIRPISAMALNKLAMALKDKHMIDDRTALDWMNVPGADEIADKLDAERQLEALARVKKH
jgi:hypothetical protein